MNNKSWEIKKILIALAVDDKLPLDLNDLDASVFDPIFEDDEDSEYGICKEDVFAEAYKKNWIISNQTAKDAIQLYGKRMDFSGDGLHGAQLIDFVLDELASEQGKEPATYVSVWDGDNQVGTTCMFNLVSGVVSDIETTDDVQDLDNLDNEYIELADGTIIDKFYNEDDNILVGLDEEELENYDVE